MMSKLKEKARQLKRYVQIIYLAYRDEATPFYARLFSFIVVAYALSPIDLIPDFIPLLGYLDDLILLPLGIYLAIKLIPKQIIERYENETEEICMNKVIRNSGTILIILIWITFILLLVYLIFLT